MNPAKRYLGSAIAIVGLSLPACAQQTAAFRPPAVPLVTSDPNLSIWSKANRLTDDVTRHWTGRPHSLVSMIRVDGRPYRLMGDEPVGVPPLPQVGVDVLPTRSIYRFANAQVKVTLTFTTPALPDDLNVLSRPVTYLTWSVVSADGVPHAVSIYDSTSSQISVNETNQKVDWGRESSGGIVAMHAGTSDQPVLGSGGDDHRIDWGYAYEAAPITSPTPSSRGEHAVTSPGPSSRGESSLQSAIGDSKALEASFVQSGKLLASDDKRMPRQSDDHQAAMAFAFDLGKVGGAAVSTHAMVAYDEVYSIDYFGRKLRPYWRRNGADAMQLLQAAERDYQALLKRCADFDNALMADMTKVGGRKYAKIGALAYRECLAANGLAADANKQPLLFTKENTSNGDIATVDVIFPMDPIFVFLSPTLAKASLVPVLSYAASDHWKFPNAPHDLGTYPLAYGTDDGGEGMPVEESGNILILCDAIAKDDGNADFAARWWPQLTQWAKYLEQYGLDPEDQLCTDDFMGHLAHNANLSIKAILALAAYGDLCRMRGDNAEAERYQALAKADAEHWMQVADAGDHSLLAFDKPGTWSQKYNLVWDRLLGLNVFPASVADREIGYYKSVVQPYGLPLDSRTTLTKSDWTMWSATMATNQADFDRFVSPLYDYLDKTTAREPLADSYITDDMHSGGMHARPVVGGIFIKMLSNDRIWHKWSRRDHTKVAAWAPLPARPKVTEIVPTSRTTQVIWKYTTAKPADGWMDPNAADSRWSTGPGPFGTAGTPGATFNTIWNTDDIWLRREFTVPADAKGNLELLVYHDEDAEVYFNGKLAATMSSYQNSYVPKPIRPEAKALLVPGSQIVLAVHCHQTTGGQGIDVGIARVDEP